MTFLLLDNEDKRIEAVKKRLCETPSSYRPQRTITREELIFVWDKSVEFDNFTDAEIASAMTALAENRYSFSTEETADARSNFGSKNCGDPLSKLYEEKLRYGLNKPEMLNKLYEELPSGGSSRPIEIIVNSIIHFASLNHQPASAYSDELNQRAGVLGNPTGDLEKDLESLRKSVEEGFEPLRRLLTINQANEA